MTLRFAELVEASERVRSTRARNAKIELLAEVLRQGAEIAPIVVGFLTGEIRQGRIGIGYAAISSLEVPPSATPELTVLELDRSFSALKAEKGAGSQERRTRTLTSIFARATGPEQHFLKGLLVGEIRQGALEGLMIEAIAKAAEVPSKDVRRAVMLRGDLGVVAEAALTKGLAGLGEFRLVLLQPIQPMLAETSPDAASALEELGETAFEYKLDGARIQVHRLGDEVKVFTRNLREVTPSVPEIVEAARALPSDAFVLDGEAIAMRRDGRPEPFQVTMQRFGRRLDVDARRAALPLSAFFFDVLHAGEDLIDRPTGERFERLRQLVPDALTVPRLVTADAEAADQFFTGALDRGFEGLVAKSLASPYEAGRRGAGWRKIKPAHTLDLVVLAVERGSGRRSGWLSNIHLGARDPTTGEFWMVGKTFKGMTDEILTWQTHKFEELATERDEYVVLLRPEIVAEIALDGVQVSPHYPSGVALRFARLRRYRLDKSPAEADTIDAVRKLLAG